MRLGKLRAFANVKDTIYIEDYEWQLSSYYSVNNTCDIRKELLGVTLLT